MLRLIPPAELHDVWGWVRNGLVACIGKTGERWLPEDVYVSLKGGQSHLFAIEHKGDEIGFTVLQQHADPDGPVLFVWAMWVEPGAGIGIEGKIVQALGDKAREIKARRIRMQSPRKGWARRALWRATAVIYEHEVN